MKKLLLNPILIVVIIGLSFCLTPLRLSAQVMFIDDFSTGNYSGDQSTGGVNWNGDWIESNCCGSGETPTSPTAGEIRVVSNRLQMVDDGAEIRRSADLSCATMAELSFICRWLGDERDQCSDG